MCFSFTVFIFFMINFGEIKPFYMIAFQKNIMDDNYKAIEDALSPKQVKAFRFILLASTFLVNFAV